MELADFLQQIPATLIGKVVNDIELENALDECVMDRKLITTMINLDRANLSGTVGRVL